MEEKSIIIDGGKMDNFIILLRWNLLFLILGYFPYFVFNWNHDPLIDGVVGYFIIVVSSLAISGVLFIFFTRFMRGKFFKTWINVSLFMFALHIASNWISCKKLTYCRGFFGNYWFWRQRGQQQYGLRSCKASIFCGLSDVRGRKFEARSSNITSA